MRGFLLVLAFVVGFHPQCARCENSDSDNAAILIHIRAIRASQPVEENAPASLKGDTTPHADMVKVDARIKDLAPKLGKLHFRCFRLISSQREMLPLGKRETVALVDGNMLTLRPLSLDSKRVGLWIKWQDGSGMQVLDTRMHFDLGESMLTGVDGAADSGLILAIDVSPVERHSPIVQPVVGEAIKNSAK